MPDTASINIILRCFFFKEAFLMNNAKLLNGHYTLRIVTLLFVFLMKKKYLIQTDRGFFLSDPKLINKLIALKMQIFYY